MGEFENAIADGVVAAMDDGEGNAPNQGTFAPGAGPDTSTFHYGGPGTSRTGGHIADLNGGAGTTAGVAYTNPGGAEGAVAEQARAVAFARAVAEAKVAHAGADESYRRFCRGPVVPSGHVAGLEDLKSSTKGTRNERCS